MEAAASTGGKYLDTMIYDSGSKRKLELTCYAACFPSIVKAKNDSVQSLTSSVQGSVTILTRMPFREWGKSDFTGG